jgi:SAM-dependent methyltransferase
VPSSSADPWLQRWLPLLRERACNRPILELGCGAGADTETLLAAGFNVIAIDRDAEQIENARLAAPTAEFYCQDIRAPFPANAIPPSVVLASLSLHYFSWEETLAIVERIRTALTAGGILLCRVNSTNDHNYGASGYPQIADRYIADRSISNHYYAVDDQPKRFFDADCLNALFADGWQVRAMTEIEIHKYSLPKFIWEIVVERKE